MSTTVTTQAGLDKALAEGVEDIVIDSPRGVWIFLSDSGSATVRAYGSATVRASGSATVRAYGSATVRAYDSATVHAYDSATVHAYDSATVRAYDSATVHAYGSATVRASDSATVHAYGSATVRASGSATVRAYGSATVHAYDSATVRAYDSATVHAYDSATVRAYDSATVHAGKYVAVHLHSKRVKTTGGVVIDVTDIERSLDTAAGWLDYYGIDVTDGRAVLFKAVDRDLNAGQSYRLTGYPIGGTVTAPDWNPVVACGQGLHFGPSPHHAGGYFNGTGQPRYLAVEVAVEGLVLLGDKVKAQSCRVLREVDVHGRAITAKEAAA